MKGWTGRDGGDRTHTPYLELDFKSNASAIPPRPHSLQPIQSLHRLSHFEKTEEMKYSTERPKIKHKHKITNATIKQV